MPKCYSFLSDALKSMLKTQDPLPGQCSGSTARLLDARYTWPQLPPSTDEGPQLGSRNQLGFSHPTSWAASVTGALGSQQVYPDMIMLPPKQSWSPFLLCKGTLKSQVKFPEILTLVILAAASILSTLGTSKWYQMISCGQDLHKQQWASKEMSSLF